MYIHRLSTVQISINNILKRHVLSKNVKKKKKPKRQCSLLNKVWSTKAHKFRDNHQSNLQDSFLLSSTGTKLRTATIYGAEDAFPRPWIRWWIEVQWQFHDHVFITMLSWAWNATFIRQQKTPNCEIIRL